MQTARIWPLYLIIKCRYGRILTAAVIFAVSFPLFYFAQHSGSGYNTPALFFSAVLAYIVPIFSLITAHCRQALRELKPQLDLSEQEFQSCLASIGGAGWKRTCFSLLLGLAGGVAHLLLLKEADLALQQGQEITPGVLIGWAGTLMIWLVMTTVIASLVDNAILFAKLGRTRVAINLLNTLPLVAFARVAIISSLAIIGAQSLFSLMYVDQTMSVESAVPGMIGMGVPLLALFAIPIWPVHRRLSDTKTATIETLNQRIRSCQGDSPVAETSGEQLGELNELLRLRREIALAPVWPFDAGSITRLILYAVIVPLTWAGAALIEMLLEASL